MEDYLDYKLYKTIIYTPSGYYGSEKLWNDASYAFQHRLQKRFWHKVNGLIQGIDDSDNWQYLTNKKEYLAEKLNIPITDLPEWDYEFIELK